VFLPLFGDDRGDLKILLIYPSICSIGVSGFQGVGLMKKDDKPVELNSMKRIRKQSGSVVSTKYRQWATRSYVWQPPTDVLETEKAFVVRCEIAGMRDSEFTVSLEGRDLIIEGKRINEDSSCIAYHQMEIHSGGFIVMVELPGPVDGEAVEANYQDGFLEINLPKAISLRVDVD
jgi:HSP20 family molecular chaperone IbpA